MVGIPKACSACISLIKCSRWCIACLKIRQNTLRRYKRLRNPFSRSWGYRTVSLLSAVATSAISNRCSMISKPGYPGRTTRKALIERSLLAATASIIRPSATSQNPLEVFKNNLTACLAACLCSFLGKTISDVRESGKD